MFIVHPLIASLVLMSALPGQGPAQPETTTPAAAPAPRAEAEPKPADEPAGGFASSDELLSALETADRSLRTLEAGVIWTKAFELGGDRHVRRGKLLYVDYRKPDADGATQPRRAFAALFESLVIGERRNDEAKHFVFDGQFIAEKVPGEKKITRSTATQGGKDPLKLGEGPMPIPIGQAKADILSRFDVTLLPADRELEGDDEAETSALRAHVVNAAQLKLVPIEGAGVENFREIRLWYRRGKEALDSQLLPRMARTVNKAGDVETVQLVDVRTNVKLDESTFNTSQPDGWSLVER